MTILEALNSGKVTISDLDTYGIFYWKVDKDGNYIKGNDNQKLEVGEQASIEQTQDMCDGVPLAPEGFIMP